MKRHTENPIVTREDIPDLPPRLVDVTSVFNPGAARFGDEIVLLLRVQNRGRETFFLPARSDDGIHFNVGSQPVHFAGIDALTDPVYHNYDARITRLDDGYYIMFAMDMDSGCHLGLAKTSDFLSYEFLGITTSEDTRNGVLFPEKINGSYWRLDRPNKVCHGGQATGNVIVLSRSDDLLAWEQTETVAAGRFHYWDEFIGPGPPPLKTRMGWLLIYHGVALHLSNIYIYQAGVMLLDLDDPAKVIGRCPYNILEPRELYELTGQVGNVVFPSGAVVEDIDAEGFAYPESRVLVYYGAADTCVCLATTTVKSLIEHAMRDLYNNISS